MNAALNSRKPNYDGNNGNHVNGSVTTGVASGAHTIYIVEDVKTKFYNYVNIINLRKIVKEKHNDTAEH